MSDLESMSGEIYRTTKFGELFCCSSGIDAEIDADPNKAAGDADLLAVSKPPVSVGVV